MVSKSRYRVAPSTPVRFGALTYLPAFGGRRPHPQASEGLRRKPARPRRLVPALQILRAAAAAFALMDRAADRSSRWPREAGGGASRRRGARRSTGVDDRRDAP